MGPWRLLSWLVVAIATGPGFPGLVSAQLDQPLAQLDHPAAQTASPAPEEDAPYLLYPLHAGEDPSRVAQLFGVPVEELLALNQIRDARRLATGTLLKVPDPRAARLAALRAEKRGLESELAAAQREVAALGDRLRALEAELAALGAANARLEARVVGYRAWQAGTAVAAAAALALLLAFLAVRARADDAVRRRRLAQREAETLRAAVERYRNLGAQLELKYQRLYGQPSPAPATEPEAQSLLREYESERARLDASLATAMRQEEPAAGGETPDGGRPDPESPLTPRKAA